MRTAPTSMRGAAQHSRRPPQRYVSRTLANEYVEITESCADGIDEIIETAVLIKEEMREELTS